MKKIITLLLVGISIVGISACSSTPVPTQTATTQTASPTQKAESISSSDLNYSSPEKVNAAIWETTQPEIKSLAIKDLVTKMENPKARTADIESIVTKIDNEFTKTPSTNLKDALEKVINTLP